MKHSKLAWIAAVACSVLAAVTFIGCGKEETPKAEAVSGAAASSGSTAFDKTTARLEKGGISYAFTDGTAATQMIDRMFDSFGVLVPADVPEAKKILDAIRDFTNELGLKTFLGSGISVKKNGDYYRCIDFEYAPEQKGLFWDLIGTAVSSGPAPELKLTSPKSAVAASAKFEPGALYSFIDKKLRSTLDEETMAVVDQQISGLNAQGIQPDKLLECISGMTFYVEGREFKEEDLQGVLAGEDPQARIMELVPKFGFVFTTKSDLCWKALENFISQSSPDIVKDGKIVPVEGIAIFQSGNYLIATNDEAAIRDRIAGKGSDLNANAEFAKMLALMPKDFSGFSWVSEDYYKTISSLSGVIGQVAGGVTGGAVPATDPMAIFGKDLHSALATSKVDAEGLTFTTVTPDLQVALLNSGTVAGTISGFLPFIGPIAKNIMDTMNNSGGLESAERIERQIGASLALAHLSEAKLPEGKCVFFSFETESGKLAFAKWDETTEEVVPVDESDEVEEFPFVLLTSPEAAAKADTPEETVVFYEDPNDFFDGVFFVFGDGSVRFLEGNFDDHAEAMEAAANTFGLSDKTASDLLKKAAAIDKLFED
jgi:hypothetical protein